MTLHFGEHEVESVNDLAEPLAAREPSQHDLDRLYRHRHRCCVAAC